jgi:hypothetical protein
MSFSLVEIAKMEDEGLGRNFEESDEELEILEATVQNLEAH